MDNNQVDKIQLRNYLIELLGGEEQKDSDSYVKEANKDVHKTGLYIYKPGPGKSIYKYLRAFQQSIPQDAEDDDKINILKTRLEPKIKKLADNCDTTGEHTFMDIIDYLARILELNLT